MEPISKGLFQVSHKKREGFKMWTINRGLRTIAGTFILASLLLAIIHSKYWLLFTAFVGINLFQSGFTN